MTETTNTEVFSRDTLKGMSVEEMLDLQVNQVEELQELATVQAFIGTFRVEECSMEPEDGENKGYFAMKISTLSVEEVEAANPHGFAEPQPGNSFTERFYPGYGVQRLTTVVKTLLGETATIRDWLEQGQGIEFSAFMKAQNRKNKETKEVRSYNELDVHNMTGPHSPTE